MTIKMKARVRVRPYFKKISGRRKKIRGHMRVVTKNRGSAPFSFEHKIRQRTELILQGNDTLSPRAAKEKAIHELQELGHIPRHTNFGAQPETREVSDILSGTEAERKAKSKFVKQLLKSGRDVKPTEPGIQIGEQDIKETKKQLFEGTEQMTVETIRKEEEELKRRIAKIKREKGSEEEER